jgi:hypothetical protein
MPSTSLISITSDMIFDLNGRKGKTITRLIDGDLLTDLDGSGTGEDDFVLPYRSMIVLPNIYGNMKFEVWESFGAGGTFRVRLYDSAKNLLGSYAKAKTAFNSWQSNNPADGMDSHTNVRYAEVYLPTTTDLNIGDYELRLYGDVMGAASSIYPGTTVTPRTDPGKYGHGINNIDDRVQQYLFGSPSTYLVPLMAASVRIGFEGTRFNIYPQSYTDPLEDSPVDIGRLGTDHINTRIFDFTRARDMHVMIYHGGGSIKNLSFAEASTSNGEYHPEANNNKYLDIGANEELVASWKGKAKLIAALGGLYGDNPAADMTGITISGGDTTLGQGGMNEIETGNELTRDWHGIVPYHNPKTYLALQKACYDEAKARDLGCLVMAPALTFLDITQLRAVYFEHMWAYGPETPFPADGFNINLYLNSDLDGQSQSGSSTGLNPETWGLKARLVSFKANVADRCFPNAKFYLSEIGFGTSVTSGYDVPAIGSKTARMVSADLLLRAKAIVRCANDLIEKIFTYAFFRDGTDNFDSMGTTNMTFGGGGSYTGNTVYEQGYALANELYVEADYEWFAEEIADGGSTGAWITVNNHKTDPLKKLFKVWRGTMNGSSGVVAVPVGANAIDATLYTLNYSDFEPDSSSALITGTNVNVTATEGMQWLEVTYEEAGNIAPVAAAGTDQTITLPTDQVTVNGSGSTDADGTISTYAWTKISGPSTFTITSPSAASTTITGLIEGTYVFRLTVTDNDGGTDTDDITITVNPANVAPTAAAGSDQSITLPTDEVTVNGSSSSDPDGTISTYAWSYVSGPVVYTITNPGNASTTITGLIAGVYVFRLTVTDDDGATGTDDVQITVNDAPGNISPVAVAGVDQSITLPVNFVTVDGTGSSDADGTIAGYEWIKASGPGTYTITSPTTAITTITGLIAGTYVFRLTVTDDDGAVHSDDVTIEVNPATPALPGNRRRYLRGTWWRNIFRRH